MLIRARCKVNAGNCTPSCCLALRNSVMAFRYSFNPGNAANACRQQLAKQSVVMLINPVVNLSGLLENMVVGYAEGIKDDSATASSDGASVASSAGASTSSSMFNPIAIKELILLANEVGSSKEKPEVSNAVSNNKVVKFFTTLSSGPLSSTLAFNALMIGDFGEISKIFLDAIPSELTGSDSGWRVNKLERNNNLLDLVAQDILQSLGQWLVLFGDLLSLLLLLLRLLKLEVLGDVDKLLVFELLQLGHGVLVNWVNQEQNFEVLGLQSVQEWRILNSLDGLTSDVVDVLLVLWHSGDVVGQRSQLVRRFCGVESQQLSQSWSVLLILVDTQLDVLGEGSVELVELLLVLSDLVESLNKLLDNVLSDNLQDLVLLQHLSGQVQWQVLRVNHTSDERKPFWNELLSLIGNEHSSDVQLDVVLLLLGLEQVEWSSLWNEQDSLELQLTLDREVLNGQWVFPVVGDRLLDWVRNELGVSLDNLLDSLLLEVLGLVLLQEQSDDRTSADPLVFLVEGNSELSTSVGFPDVLLVVIVLGDHLNVVSNQEKGVETHTELTNHRDICTGRESLHESLSTRFSDGTQVLHQLSFGHTNTGISDLKNLLFWFWCNSDEKLWLCLKDRWVGESLVSDFVQGVRSVRDQFSEEDFLVRVNGVNEQGHQLRDLSLELIRFTFRRHSA
ncbi:hypothetical protein OGAPHI_000643 [Ogataea philodendri]|uniref:Uncharacterized protein n=1 Tax=Ogataea philodendri TaxID=1378263 RepID=A0A9P8PGP5_9ASCO|nr:uncharacterized protein OGAPHI_000643 [Ogataea philodendri]KAH3670932.1 hypothetical protein OGAPHI_000643 [Ogataea philodendri]